MKLLGDELLHPLASGQRQRQRSALAIEPQVQIEKRAAKTLLEHPRREHLVGRGIGREGKLIPRRDLTNPGQALTELGAEHFEMLFALGRRERVHGAREW